MAHRPRVAVTGNARAWSPGWWCTALSLRLAGAAPFRVSVDHGDEATPVQAIVIGGGDDIDPELYGGNRALSGKGDPARDRLEMSWIERGLKEGLPLLGICRGAQLLNVVLGGTLHQDLRPLRRLTHNRPGLLPTKSVALEEGTALAMICGTTSLRVNSLHRQAVDRTGRGLIE